MDNSFNGIMKRLLDKVDDSVDKREGSFIYNALAPAAVEMEMLYIEQENNQKESYADTASREYLIKRAKERGIRPYLATKAVVKAEISPSILNIEVGSRFSIDDVVYIVTGKIDESHIRMECETAGKVGNKSAGQLVPVEYIDGLQSIVITELLIPGEDEEETERFRKRYFNSFDSQAWGGNREDYKQKTKALPGVGGVKVDSAWNGPGTVKLTIISSIYDVPSSELVQRVQKEIDPPEFVGQGYGIAGIDHVVTVDGLTSQVVNIQTSITYQPGWDYNASKSYIEKAIDEYFLELAKNWEDETQLVVRISQIETRLLNVQGVLDIQKTKLNGQSVNLLLGEKQIPKRGVVSE